MLIRICSILLTWAILGAPSALAKLEVISVAVEGVGATKSEAVSDGLVQAISQVNGAEIAANTMSSLKEQSSIGPDGENYALDETYQKDIISKTNGVVNGWTVQSEKQDPELSNLWIVGLTVQVSKYTTSKQLSRLRMAVGEFRPKKADDGVIQRSAYGRQSKKRRMTQECAPAKSGDAGTLLPCLRLALRLPTAGLVQRHGEWRERDCKWIPTATTTMCRTTMAYGSTRLYGCPAGRQRV